MSCWPGQADVGFLQEEGKLRLRGVTAMPRIKSYLVLCWGHTQLPAASIFPPEMRAVIP